MIDSFSDSRVLPAGTKRKTTVTRLAEAEAEALAKEKELQDKKTELAQAKAAKRQLKRRLRKERQAKEKAEEQLRQEKNKELEERRAAEAATAAAEPRAALEPASAASEASPAAVEPSSAAVHAPELPGEGALEPQCRVPLPVLEMVASHADPASRGALLGASAAARPLAGSKVSLKTVNDRGHEQVPSWLRDLVVKHAKAGECLSNSC